MKKFLTVLLALSVVFTYTVGTAFAAPVVPAAEPTHDEMVEFSKNVDKVAGEIKDDFARNYDKAVESYFDDQFTDKTISGHVTSKAATKKGAEAFKGAYTDAVDKVAKDAKDAYGKDTANVPNIKNYLDAGLKAKGFGAGIYDAATIENVFDVVFNKVAASDVEELIQVAALVAAFDEAKAEVVDILSNYMDLSMYSTTVQEIKADFDDDGEAEVKETSYRALAEDLVGDLIAKVNGTYLDTLDETVALVDAKFDIIDEVATHYAPIDGSFKYKLVNTPAYLITGENEEDNATNLELAKEEALAQMTASVAEFLKYVNDENLSVAEWKATTEAYKESQTYRINSAKTTPIAAPKAMLSSNSAELKVYVDNVKAIKDLEAYAAKYALEKDSNGNLLRDADKIADVVTKAKNEAYAYNGTGAAWDGLVAAEKNIRDNCYVAEAKTKYEVEVRKALIEDEREKALLEADGSDKYYAPEAEKVNALFDALLAKVDAAKDDTAVKKVPVKPTDAELTAIHTKAQVIALVKATANFKADIKEIDYEEGLVNYGLKAYDDAYVNFENYNYDFFADSYAENGVRVNADITDATFELAKAAIHAAKTNATLAAEKAAVEALIDAIPTRLTEAAKPAVEAAEKAYNEYHDNTATVEEVKNVRDLDDAIAKFYAVDKSAVEALADKLPALTLVKVADKAAVQEFLTAAKAFKDATEEDGLYKRVTGANDAAKVLVSDAKAYFDEVRELEAANVVDLINKLPLNITLADKAQVEAARAAYDAFVAEYTDYEEPCNAAESVTNFRELALAEAAIEAAENAAAIKAVEGLKIKASSSAVKGKITVKWSVTGDVPAGTVYKVYKSTKAQSGYAYMGKTTKNYMANKKNLKKGKRYFYKVKAVLVVDGVAYTSDWSNKANRFAK